MITQSGAHIQRIGGAAGTPTAMDIAVHAGRICRFGGAVWSPLLAHLVFVGLLSYRRSGRTSNLTWGLLHDAHEIVTGEIPRPFKCDCMRREQGAIDTRLLTRFFGLRGAMPGYIDFDLIKQCDIDACHIEGVALGLPGFAETELKCGEHGRTEMYSDPDDVKLFHRVREIFGGPEVVTGQECAAVRTFASLLLAAERKDADELRVWANGWVLVLIG